MPAQKHRQNPPRNTRPHLGRPPADRSPDSRERLLDSAFALFATQGAAATTLAQIARDAGVTPAMAHYHFGNREGLLDALGAVAAFVDRLLDAVDRLPLLPALWSREILSGGGLLRERIMRHVPEAKVAALFRALEAARQAGRLHPRALPGLIPAAVMGLVMLPLAARPMLDRLSGGTDIDRESLRRHALAVLLDGLVPRNDNPNPEP